MSDSDAPKLSASGWKARLLVLLVLVVAAVGIQWLIKARAVAAKSSCNSNLKLIDAAVQHWALENKKTATDTYSLRDAAVLSHMRGSMLPECPNHGRYLPGTSISDASRCTIGGISHSL